MSARTVPATQLCIVSAQTPHNPKPFSCGHRTKPCGIGTCTLMWQVPHPVVSKWISSHIWFPDIYQKYSWMHLDSSGIAKAWHIPSQNTMFVPFMHTKLAYSRCPANTNDLATPLLDSRLVQILDFGLCRSCRRMTLCTYFCVSGGVSWGVCWGLCERKSIQNDWHASSGKLLTSSTL